MPKSPYHTLAIELNSKLNPVTVNAIYKVKKRNPIFQITKQERKSQNSNSKYLQQSIFPKTETTLSRAGKKLTKMVKKMGYNWKSWWRSVHKNNYFVVKMGVLIVLVGFAFWVLCDFSPVSDSNFLQNSQISSPPVVSVNSHENMDQIIRQENGKEPRDSEEKCNLFIGDWVPSKAEPLYTNSTCSFIEDHQNCMMNGRPDTGYLYWKWNPHGCELPRLNAKRFLQLLRNKTWAFIGDSISRNHVQSFLCLLSTVEKAVEVYHDENYKNRRWFFPMHNFTVSVIWAPFLAKADIFEDMNGVSTSEVELHFDILDKNWTDPYNSLDYMIFSSGKWFTKPSIYYENNNIIGCHYCKRNFTELGFNFAYRKVIRHVLNYIISSNHKGMIFYRTSTPDHFEGGEWFSGGTCKRKSPVKEAEFEMSNLDRILRDIELDEFEKVSVMAVGKGVKLKLFDVSPLSLMRPDGHPGPYRFFQPFAKDKNASVISDCLHWCLPGPIDAWNDILGEMVVNG